MSEIVVSKDAAKLLRAIYKEYLKRKKDNHPEPDYLEDIDSLIKEEFPKDNPAAMTSALDELCDKLGIKQDVIGGITISRNAIACSEQNSLLQKTPEFFEKFVSFALEFIP